MRVTYRALAAGPPKMRQRRHKLPRKWLPTTRLARSLHDIDFWLYHELTCPLCLRGERKWRSFDSVVEIVNHCIDEHFTEPERFLLEKFLVEDEKKVAQSDDVQAVMDDVLEERGKRDILTSLCFCPFCLVINDHYNPYANLRSFRTHFQKAHLSAR